MNRVTKWYNYLTINVYYLGLTTVAQTNGLVFPLLVQQFVGESEQGTYFGILRLWSLMMALLAQSIMGMISDQSRSKWGRRRPFIFAGTVFNCIFIGLIGFLLSLTGTDGFWLLFVIAIFSQISSNSAQAAQQGLIPDLVPEEKRGRFSGVKALLELPLPLLLVSFTIARLIGNGYMWFGILVAMAVLLISMLITMLVSEEPLENEPPPMDWSPFLRLLLMAGIFTSVILGMGQVVKILGILLITVHSTLILVAVMGVVGLTAMCFAVGIGVWISIRISLGEKARQYPSFSWWVVNRLAFLAGVTNISIFALFFLQSRLGYEKETAAQPAAILMLVVGFFVLIAALPSGWLADRFGHKKLVAISGMMATIGTIIALLTPNLNIIYIGACLIGASTGIFYTANWALGTAVVPSEEAGRFLGLSNLAGAGAGAVGAYIGGPIADFFTLNLPNFPGLGYILLFCIFGALFFLSVISLTWIKTIQPSPK
jgi:MFS family permease